MNNNRDCEHGRRNGDCDTCDLIESEQEILALRAQIEVLHKAIYRQQRKEGWHEEHPLVTLCIATPTQCLAEIRAQAVEDAAEALYNSGITTPEACIWLDINYANQIRQQAKEQK